MQNGYAKKKKQTNKNSKRTHRYTISFPVKNKTQIWVFLLKSFTLTLVFYQAFCYSLYNSGLEEIVLCQNTFLTNHHRVALGLEEQN